MPTNTTHRSDTGSLTADNQQTCTMKTTNPKRNGSISRFNNARETDNRSNFSASASPVFLDETISPLRTDPRHLSTKLGKPIPLGTLNMDSENLQNNIVKSIQSTSNSTVNPISSRMKRSPSVPGIKLDFDPATMSYKLSENLKQSQANSSNKYHHLSRSPMNGNSAASYQPTIKVISNPYSNKTPKLSSEVSHLEHWVNASSCY